MADRIAGTTWDCRWIALGPDAVGSDVARIEVKHALSFSSDTLDDDLPYRLQDWAAKGPEANWRVSVANFTGLLDLDGTPMATLDDVAWTPFSDDVIVYEATLPYDGYSYFDYMTIRWDSQGMWYSLHQQRMRARCTPVAGGTGR